MFLFLRCREKGFEEERNKNKDGNSGGYNKLVTVERGRDDEILISYLLARITLTLMSSSNYTGCFQKVNFQEFNFCTYINFELSSAFFYALCELLEK